MRKLFLDTDAADVRLRHPCGHREWWFYLPDEAENPVVNWSDCPRNIPSRTLGTASAEYCIRNFMLMTRPEEGWKAEYVSERFKALLAEYAHVPTDEDSLYSQISAPEDA